MKDSIRLFLAGAWAVILVAGCIPNRDNKNDPTLRPQARLSYSVGLPSSGACIASSSTSNATSFSRGNCVLLKADQSSDPAGASNLTSRNLYILRAAPQEPINGVPIPTCTGTTNGTNSCTSASCEVDGSILKCTYLAGNSLMLAPADLRLLPFAKELDYTVSVAVADKQGYVDTSLGITFTLTHQPITISPPSKVVVPFFGKAWEPASLASLPITLAGGAATDSDGDPLCNCWTPVIVPSDQQANIANGQTCTGGGLPLTLTPSATSETVIFSVQSVLNPSPVGNPAGCLLPAAGQQCTSPNSVANSCSAPSLAVLQLAPHLPGWAVLSSETTGASESAELFDVDHQNIGLFPQNNNTTPQPIVNEGMAFLFNADPTQTLICYAITPAGQGGVPHSILQASTAASFSAATPVPTPFPFVSSYTAGTTTDYQFMLADPLPRTPNPRLLWVWGENDLGPNGAATFTVWTFNLDNIAAGPLESFPTALSTQGGGPSAAYDPGSPTAVPPVPPTLWLSEGLGAKGTGPVFQSFELGGGGQAYPLLSQGDLLSGIAARRTPLDGQGHNEYEIWVVESFDALQPTVGSPTYPPPVIRTFRGGVETDLPLDTGSAANTPRLPVSLAFVDPDSALFPNIFWTDMLGEGITAFEVTSTSGTLAVSTLVQIPGATIVDQLVVNPLTGDVLAVEGGQEMFHGSLDGSSLSTESLADNIAAFAGPDLQGLFWAVTADPNLHQPSGLERGAGTAAEAVLGQFPVPLALEVPAVDYRSGDLVFAQLIPPAIVRLGTTGTRIDEIDQFMFVSSTSQVLAGNYTIQTPPVLSSVSLNPNGDDLWVASGRTPNTGAADLFHVLPTAPRPLPNAAPLITGDTIHFGFRPVLDQAVDPITGDIIALTFGPVSPATNTTAYALALDWFTPQGAQFLGSAMIAGPGSSNTLSVSNLNGSNTPAFSRDISDGGVCVAYEDDPSSGSSMHVRRFKGISLNQPFNPANAPDGPDLADVAGSSGLGNGYDGIAASLQDCWLATRPTQNGAVAVFRPEGNGGAGQFLGGPGGVSLVGAQGVSIFPLDLSVSQASGPRSAIVGGQGSFTLLQVDPPGGTNLTLISTTPVAIPVKIVAP